MTGRILSRLLGLAVLAWLPCQSTLAETPASADACSVCTARHKSLQALQASRTGAATPNKPEANMSAEPDDASAPPQAQQQDQPAETSD